MSSYGEVFASQIASTMPSSTLMQDAATGNGNGTSLNVQGYASCILSITASVAMGGGTTIHFEASVDDSTWVAMIGTDVSSGTVASSTTTTGNWAFNIAGYRSIRARIGSYSSGTITVQGYASVLYGLAGSNGGSGGGSVDLYQINGTTVSQGNGTAGNGCQRVTVASDNSAFATICSGVAKGGTSAASATVTPIDSDHNALDVYVRGGGSGGGDTSLIPGTAATYISSDPQFTPGASATDIWTMYGSNSKTVKILYVGLHYVSSTGGIGTFFLLRRSSTNSGGTSSNTTPTKMSSGIASATATITSYTSNPSSLGSSAGQLLVYSGHPVYLGTAEVYMPTPDAPLFDYRLIGQPIVLSGTSEGIAVNCNGTSPAGASVKVSVRVIFTEE